MSRDNSAQRMTTSPHEQALLLDEVAQRCIAHNGWPNGQRSYWIPGVLGSNVVREGQCLFKAIEK